VREGPSGPPAAGSGPIVAVLGDSISDLTVLPQNPVGCHAGPGPTGCQYTENRTLNYPGVLRQITGANVQFYHQGNLETTESRVGADGSAIGTWLGNGIQRIPPDAAVVVLEAGFQDLNLSGCNPKVSSRLITLTDAARAKAPHAKIVFIGTRFCGAAGDAWNATGKSLADRYGAFIDLRAIAPDGPTPQFPDGIHAGPDTNRRIGSELARAVLALTSAQPAAAR